MSTDSGARGHERDQPRDISRGTGGFLQADGHRQSTDRHQGAEGRQRRSDRRYRRLRRRRPLRHFRPRFRLYKIKIAAVLRIFEQVLDFLCECRLIGNKR